YILCLFCDHRVEAAHHSRECDGPVRIGNNQVFRRELAVNSVESFQRFPIAGAPNHDLAALQKIEIERVRGMPHLPQRVVRSIRRIVDRALTNQSESRWNVRGRSLDLYAPDDLCLIASA